MVATGVKAIQPKSCAQFLGSAHDLDQYVVVVAAPDDSHPAVSMNLNAPNLPLSGAAACQSAYAAFLTGAGRFSTTSSIMPNFTASSPDMKRYHCYARPKVKYCLQHMCQWLAVAEIAFASP